MSLRVIGIPVQSKYLNSGVTISDPQPFVNPETLDVVHNKTNTYYM